MSNSYSKFLVQIPKKFIIKRRTRTRGILTMRRSKLEIYADVLKVLAREGPLRLTHIMHKANVCYNILKQCLDCLVQQNLVEEQTLSERRVVYAITKRGLMVLKHFRELNISLPTIEEPRKIPAMLY